MFVSGIFNIPTCQQPRNLLTEPNDKGKVNAVTVGVQREESEI